MSLKKKPAFTLIELILVITIIGILSSILVLNFSGIRQRQQLSLMADQALAMMQQARGDVMGGKVRDGEVFLCEGAYFEQGKAPEFALADYNREEKACDFTTFTTALYGLSNGNAFVESITVGDLAVNTTWAFFTPPEAELIFYSETGELYTGDGDIRFAHDAVTDFNLELRLSALTGLASLSTSHEDAL